MNARPAHYAGSWYPGGRMELANWLDKVLAPEKDHVPYRADLLGVVAPHAGYIYSGSCAATAYKTLCGWAPERIIVLAPSHREAYSGCCCWSPVEGEMAAGEWRIPTGHMPLDLKTANELHKAWPRLRFGSVGHKDEHSLELQLPFLLHLFGETPFLPLSVGRMTANESSGLADAIGGLLDTRATLLVASTDLSHFHSQEQALELDDRFRQLLESCDTGLMWEAAGKGSIEACGMLPVLLMMEALSARKRRLDIQVTGQCTSADHSGDTDEVVGYLAAVARCT